MGQATAPLSRISTKGIGLPHGLSTGQTMRVPVSGSSPDGDECKLVRSNLAGRTGSLDEEDHKHSIAGPQASRNPHRPGCCSYRQQRWQLSKQISNRHETQLSGSSKGGGMKQPSWGREAGFAAANHGPKIVPDLQVPGCAGGEKAARSSASMDVPGASGWTEDGIALWAICSF